MSIQHDAPTLRDVPLRSGPIVVGDDGGSAGRDALALAHRLGDLLGARVDVVACSGAVHADVLRGLAMRESAAVIVLGPTHRHALARTLRGTARRMLRDAPCPVAVAPAGFADRPRKPLRRVAVGVEPAGEADLPLHAAHELASRARAKLLAVGVVRPLSPPAVEDLRDGTTYLAEELHAVQLALELALADLPAGVPRRALAVAGDPAVELATVSAEVDLLVCGSRRRSPLRAALLGSVTERLLRGAACPVLAVPSGHVAPSREPARRHTLPSPVLRPPRG